MRLYYLHGTQHHQSSTPQSRQLILTISTTNTRVSGMIARSSGSSGGRHSNPADVSTDGMTYQASGNGISYHGYLTNNAIFSHDDPTNSVRTSREPKKST